MSGINDPFSLFSRLQLTIDGGQAPKCQQREMIRKIAPLGHFGLAGKWIKKLNALNIEFSPDPFRDRLLVLLTERYAPSTTDQQTGNPSKHLELPGPSRL